tara:strand:- start:2349 stop:2591 length:243 start_codon:yes stop_codon:yes gene_type:complete
LGPRCGRGWLFNGPLQVNERCDHYDVDFSPHNTGGGAAVFAILSLGALVVALAILWPFKGILIGLHLKNLRHKYEVREDG